MRCVMFVTFMRQFFGACLAGKALGRWNFAVTDLVLPAKNFPQNDEIDLVELLRSLWTQKLLIALIAGTCTFLAGIYAFLATPVYQVQSVMRPALIKDLDELNRTGIYELSPSAALSRIGAALDSYENRLGYFKSNPQLFASLDREGQTLEQAFERFNETSFAMQMPDPKKADTLSPYLGIQLTYPHGIDGVSVVNGLVAHTIQRERERLGRDLQAIIQNRLKNLQLNITSARANYETSKEARIVQLTEADKLKRVVLQDELTALRQQLKTRRENRIQQLGEAIHIAKSLGISKPTTPSALGQDQRVSQGSVVRTEVNNQQIPLYFMGAEALEAERKTLLQRKSDDFTEPRIAEITKELQLLESNRQIEVLKLRENEDLFLTDLAAWHAEEARLRNLRIDTNALQLVTLDQVATEPRRPIKPKKLLILVLGVVLGGMLGVFGALVRHLLRPKQQHAYPLLVDTPGAGSN